MRKRMLLGGGEQQYDCRVAAILVAVLLLANGGTLAAGMFIKTADGVLVFGGAVPVEFAVHGNGWFRISVYPHLAPAWRMDHNNVFGDGESDPRNDDDKKPIPSPMVLPKSGAPSFEYKESKKNVTLTTPFGTILVGDDLTSWGLYRAGSDLSAPVSFTQPVLQLSNSTLYFQAGRTPDSAMLGSGMLTNSTSPKLNADMGMPLVTSQGFQSPHVWCSDGYSIFAVAPQLSSSAPFLNISWAKANTASLWSFGLTRADFYVAPAQTYLLAKQSLWRLTGVPALPPAHALAFLASRSGWDHPPPILNTLATFAQKNIPVGAIVADYEWFTNISDASAPLSGLPGFSDFNLNEKVIINGSRFFEQLHAQGVRFGGVRWPRVASKEAIEDLDDLKCIIPNTRNINLREKKCRQWYTQKLKPLVNDGVDFFWNIDGTSNYFTYHWWNIAQVEAFPNSMPLPKTSVVTSTTAPATQSTTTSSTTTTTTSTTTTRTTTSTTSTTSSTTTTPTTTTTTAAPPPPPPLSALHALRDAATLTTAVAGDEARLLTLQGRDDDFPSLAPAAGGYVRPFSLNQGFTPGMQRLGAVSTLSDIPSGWDALAALATQVLGYAMSGVAFPSIDIGGNGGAALTDELLVRWYQLGLFTPIARCNSARGNAPNFPFDVQTAEASHAISAAIHARAALFPTIYSAAIEQSEHLFPLMRHPFADFPDATPHLLSVNNQWMLSKSLMVCPVVSRGAKFWSISLPPDTWYLVEVEFSTTSSTLTASGISTTISVSLSDVLLFARAGTLLALGNTSSIERQPPELLHIYIYPGRNASITVYEDDGLTVGGVRRETAFAWDDSRMVLSWERTGQLPIEKKVGFEVVQAILFSGSRVPELANIRNIDSSGFVDFSSLLRKRQLHPDS